MNKLLLYIVVGAIIVVGGWYVLSGRGGTGAPAGQEPATTTSATSTQAATLASLIASNVAQKCTFDDATSAAKTSGTVYIGDGKMRGDFSAVASGGETQSVHMISDGTTAYTWIEGISTGFRSSMSAHPDTGAGSNPGLDPSKPLDYQCAPWTVDATLFELPAGYSFTDISTMLQGTVPPLPAQQ